MNDNTKSSEFMLMITLDRVFFMDKKVIITTQLRLGFVNFSTLIRYIYLAPYQTFMMKIY